MPNQILLDAATRLETHGWIQGAYAKDSFGKIGRVQSIPAPQLRETCVIGALIAVDAYGELEVLRESLGVIAVADWNDDPKRTKSEVIAALRKAAK